jgi:enediyne biosynthesis protein E3
VPIRLLERLLTISPKEASFASRGFEVSDLALSRKLEAMLASFIAGYNLAVRTPDPFVLSDRLHSSFDNHHVGFAFEGVGLYLAMLDLLVPGKSTRLAAFLNGAGQDHDYIISVGAGFAIARVPWGLRALNRYCATLDSLFAWCVPDGYGFHEGFFHHRRYIDSAHEPPRSLPPLARQLFDSGLGRAMWWVKCGNPVRIASAINNFPENRRAELWTGIGTACSYAGGVESTDLVRLRELSGSFQADFLSGLPFSARLRQKAGNDSPITDMACRILMGRSTDETANMAEAAARAARRQVPSHGITVAYDLVRKNLVAECRTLVEVTS